MERDKNLRSLKKARRKCVGLCYILRQTVDVKVEFGLTFSIQEKRGDH